MGKYKGFRGGAGMNTGKNMNSMLKQAQKMQEEMERIQAEVEEKTIETTAGGGMVTVVANGKKEILSIKIKPEVVDPDDIEMLEDLIVAATNEALRQMEDENAKTMESLTGGFGLGGGLPF